jgi:hypothetical protein
LPEAGAKTTDTPPDDEDTQADRGSSFIATTGI